MNFKDMEDKKIAAGEVGSHAECLAAMDCLMHHLNDEDEIACWLQDGVPDNDHWRMNAPYPERAEFYDGLAEGMTYGDYEACVKMFAKAVKRQCFMTKYQPRSFT